MANQRHRFQISWRAVKPLLRYNNVNLSKMAADRHLGFLKVWNFNGRYGLEVQYASPCQISCRSI